ncbi:MAG: DUF11 domain-containing protein [Planctomycetota bacterium]
MVSVFRDTGNGVLDPASDTLVQSATTAASGRYAFNRLAAGDYFVVQDAQVVGGRSLQRSVSPIITIDGTAVEGRIIRVVDDFDQTEQQVIDTTNDGVPVTSSVAAPEAIGGERDLFVNKTSVNGAVQLNVDNPLLPNLLTFDSLATGNGERRVTWDGPDGDATTVDDTGLGAEDLSSANDALGLQLQIGADLPGGQAVVRLYSDDGIAGTADRFSTATLSIPQTGGSVASAEFLPFSSFVASSGGGVDINNVGAIELDITGAANVNGTAELVGTVGENVFTADFDNFETADLSLTKTVDDATPGLGQNVTFGLTLRNAGPDNATGVSVRDVLPDGLTFVSQAASVGSYDSATGVWSVGSVASGGNVTLAITARVDSAGSRTNFAEVIASEQFDPDSQPDFDNTSPDDTSQDDQALVQILTEAIDLSLTKSASVSEVPVGSNVTFALQVSNAGPSDATGVVVQDLLPAGVTFVSSVPSQGSFDSGSGLWSVGNIASGTSQNLSIVARVDVAGNKTNTAQVFAADQTDVDSTPNNGANSEDDQASVVITSPQIDLSLTKSVSDSTPDVGQSVTFTIVVSNSGPDGATGVNVLDRLPAGLSFVSASTGQGTFDNATGTWNVGSISAGANATLGIVAMVDSAGAITNTAQVSSAVQPDADSTPNNSVATEDDQASVTLQAQQIDLSVSKSADDVNPNRGQNVTFTVTVSNAGPTTATGVVIRDMLPAGLTFVSSDPSVGSYNTTSGLWTVGSLAASTSQTLQLVARVDSMDAFTNSAEVIAADQTDVDSFPNNNLIAEDDQASLLITPATADLSITKLVDDNLPNVGQNVTFTVTVRNDGPATASGIQITDALPDGISFVSSAPSQGSFNSTSGLWTVGSLADGVAASLQVVGRVDRSGPKTNTAQITSADQFDPDSIPNNNVSTEDDQSSVVLTPPVADLSLTKTVDQARPDNGSTVRYTVTVANAGPSAGSGIVVNDDLPSGMTFVTSTPSVGTYDPITGRWDLGNIPVGGSATLLIDAIVGTNATTTNVAEIVAADQFDPDSTPGNASDSEDDLASVAITPSSSDLSLTKTVNSATPNVGENVVFTIDVSNAGPDPATGVSVRDLLPPGLAFQAANPSQGAYDPTTGVWTIGNLPLGGSVSLNLTAAVSSVNVATNVAEIIEVDQRDPDSIPGNDLESEDDRAIASVRGQQVDLSLTKSVNDATPNVGDEVSFEVTIRNDGVSDATGVQVRDVLPVGMSLRRTQPSQGSFNTTSSIWSVGNLQSGGTANLIVFARVDQIIDVENVAEVISADQPDLDSTAGNGVAAEDDQSGVVVRTPVADLSLTKTVNQPRPNVGEIVVFDVVVTNDGPDAATGVQVTDRLPTGIRFISNSLSQGTFDGVTGIWNLGELASGNTAMLSVNGLIENVPTDPGAARTNTAEITAVNEADSDSTPGNLVASEDDQDDAVVTPALADLSLEKVVSNSAPSLGDIVTYTLTVRNDGPDGASGIQVRDVLPDGVMLTSANEFQGSFNAANGVWFVGDVAVGASADLQLNVVVASSGEQVNRAELVAADQFDPDSTPDNGLTTEDDHASVALRAREADLSLTKMVDNPRPGVGEEIVFTVEIANAGPDAAQGIIVRDNLPDGVRFVNAMGSSGSYSSTTGQWVIQNLASGQSASLEIRAIAETFGDKTNTAEIIASSEFDPDSVVNNGLANEDDQASVTISPELVDLALVKMIDQERPNRGDAVTYTLRVVNDGPSSATGVQIRDLLGDNLMFDAAMPSQGTYSPLSGIWDVGTIAPGTSLTLQLRAVVGDTAGETNIAEVVAVAQPDADSTPDNGNVSEDDHAEVSFTTQVSDLSLGKSVNRTTADQNEPVIFTLTLSNAGPDDATNVVVRDVLPAGLNFAEANTASGAYDVASGDWVIPRVAQNDSVTLQILATVTGREAQVNMAEVMQSDQFDPDSVPGNGQAAEDDLASVTVTPIVVDVSVAAAVDELEPLEGEEITLTFTARNDGPSNATGLQFRTSLPTGLTLVSVSPERGTYDAITGIWSLPSLDSGGQTDLVFRALVDERGLKRQPIELIAADQIDVDSDPGNGIATEDDQEELLIRAPRLLTKRLFLAR